MSNHGINNKRNRKLAEDAKTCELSELAEIYEKGFCSPLVREQISNRIKKLFTVKKAKEKARKLNSEKKIFTLKYLQKRLETEWIRFLPFIKTLEKEA